MKLKKLEQGVYELDSGVRGPILSIIGGIHGNEPCGLELLEYIKKDFVFLKGRLFLITGNLDAISKNVRQCDVNLNRIFKEDSLLSRKEKDSREYKHMQRIKKYLNLSDACLDIHSSPTKESPVFAICEKKCFRVVENFPVDRVCEGFAEVEPGGTDYYMNKNRKPGICIECGYHSNGGAAIRAKESFIAFLRHFKMYEGSIKGRAQEYLKATRAYLTKTNIFKITKDFQDFQEIKQGEVLGYDGDEAILASCNGFIVFARDRRQVGVEAFTELRKS